jgi:hypothetical protein
MLSPYTNNKYYNFDNSLADFDNSEHLLADSEHFDNSLADSEHFDNSLADSGHLLSDSEHFNHLNNSRNNLNNVEPYVDMNSNYESYSNMEPNNSDSNYQVERYDSTKMSEYVKMLEKKIPSNKQKSSESKAIKVEFNRTLTKPIKNSSANIKDLSIDMTPFINKYKKNRNCSTALIINSTYIKTKPLFSKNNMSLIYEYLMYVLLFGIFYCVFTRTSHKDVKLF